MTPDRAPASLQPDCLHPAPDAALTSAAAPNSRRGVLMALSAMSAGLLAAGPVAAATAPGTPAKKPAKSFVLGKAVTVTARRLDDEVAAAFPRFDTTSVLPKFDPKTLGAHNDVVLHRITTTTKMPETGETVKVTGLLALPVGAKGSLPVVSWQHGTILSFDQVPSNLTKMEDPAYKLSDAADSLETLFNVQRFAARGFAVIAADYIGKGPLRDGRGETYAVKGVSTQNCIDILDAGLAALRKLHVTPGKLFLHGWSEGALNTQWLHQTLRSKHVEVTGTAVASPFNDLSECVRYWTGHLSFPLPPGMQSYPAVPDWGLPCVIILLGSYETQYGIKGLLETAVRPEYRAMARQYWTDYQVSSLNARPVPTIGQFLVPDLLTKYTHDNNSKFLRLLAASTCSYWDYDRPIRFHYGLADEAIHPEMTYRALSAGGKMTHGVPVPKASHRLTFLAGLYGDAASLSGNDNALSWFSSLL